MKQIVQRPHITEKSMQLAQRGWYAFVVDQKAQKFAIGKAVSTLYKVKVLDVRTSRMPGKSRRVGKKMQTITKQDWKKAFVRLSPGQTIPAFEVTDTQSTGK